IPVGSDIRPTRSADDPTPRSSPREGYFLHEDPAKVPLPDTVVHVAATPVGLAVLRPYHAWLIPRDGRPPSSFAPPVRRVWPPIPPGDRASGADLRIRPACPAARGGAAPRSHGGMFQPRRPRRPRRAGRGVEKKHQAPP